LQGTAKKLRGWAKSIIGNNKLLLLAARELIWILDVVQEYRQLSAEELLLKRDLKNRYP
jgi:phage anti-repressor protein